MGKRVLLVCLVLLLYGPYVSIAQYDLSTFKHHTIDDGLSQNSVTCILQDSSGFMWFGTQDGLNRFDGFEYQQYRNERQNQNSLSNNYIWDLYEDEDRVLWIATFGGGLNSLNLLSGEIKRFKSNPNDPASFPSNRVFSIVEFPKGTLWIGSNEGLIKFEKATGRSQLFLSEKAPNNTLEDNFIGTIAVGPNGYLWLQSDAGLTQFDPKTDQAVHFKNSPFSKVHTLGTVRQIKNVGGALIITCTAGLLAMHPDQKTDTLLVSAAHIPIGNRTAIFQEILHLGGYNYAIGTNRGLIFFNSKTGARHLYQSDPADTKSLSHSNVLSLFRSKDDILWIGTRNGLNKIESEKPDFIHIRHIPGKAGLSAKNVNSFMEENDSLLWVGTTDGVNLYNKNNNTFQVFRKEDNSSGGLQTNYVLCLFKDSRGNKWMGTRGNGFYKIERSSKGEIRFRHIQPKGGNTSNVSVHFIEEDKDGILWVGTGGQGLWKYNPIDNTVKIYATAKDGTGPNHPYVFAILCDSFDNIWLGTPTGGLNLFDPVNERFIYFQNEAENPNSLSNDIILSLYEDRQQQLWIGTNGGLSRLISKLERNMFDRLRIEIGEKNDSLFKNFNEEQGFPNGVIYGILEDRNQNLWTSTNKGIAAFDLNKEQVVKTFDVSHGLQNNEFNQNGYFKNKKGKLFFGGVDGFTIFHPDSIRGNQHVPPVVLTNLSLFNEPVPIGKNGSFQNFKLEKALHSLDEISLSWKHDVITFDFAALSYIGPEKNNYRFMLSGFNEDWVEAGNTRTATYTNLDPGDYEFKVTASNSSGVWNETGTSLKLNISTPPWTSWYAYLGYFILASGLLYFLIRHRIDQATRKITVQRQIEKARTQEREAFRKRSSRDFHDEAGTKITRISLITELVKLNTTDNPQIQEHLVQIGENLQDLNNGMRDFIWALDPDKDNAFDTLNRFTEFAGKFCEYGGIQFKSENISEELKAQELNMAARRNLLLILKEALNNSVKHGKPTVVNFKINPTPGRLDLVLHDNGSGFDTSESSSGNGLGNMKERANTLGAVLTLTSEENKGTTLQLTMETT